MPEDSSPNSTSEGLAFLLSQVGAHSALMFSQRVSDLELSPPQVGILKVIGEFDGLSQQALGEKLGMFASRLVSVLDDLQSRGLIERKSNPTDRRTNSLYLTKAGSEKMKHIKRVARDHQESLCAALDDAERLQLAALLQRIAQQQNLTPGIHPGYRRMNDATNQDNCS